MALATREIHPNQASLEIYSTEQEKSPEKRPQCRAARENTNNFYCMSQILLEHTYMKNYSSFAENSNLTGPPGFLLAVLGNYAPSTHGSQTLEREKATNPLHVLGVFFRVLPTVFSLGFYLMH